MLGLQPPPESRPELTPHGHCSFKFQSWNLTPESIFQTGLHWFPQPLHTTSTVPVLGCELELWASFEFWDNQEATLDSRYYEQHKQARLVTAKETSRSAQVAVVLLQLSSCLLSSACSYKYFLWAPQQRFLNIASVDKGSRKPSKLNHVTLSLLQQ